LAVAATEPQPKILAVQTVTIPYLAPLPQLVVAVAGHTTRPQIHRALMAVLAAVVHIHLTEVLPLHFLAHLAAQATLQALRHLKVLTVAQEMARLQTLVGAVAAALLLPGQQEHQQLAATAALARRPAFLAHP
jgi:hypothetical protein